MDETLAIKDQLIKAFQDLIQSIINGAPKVVTGIVLLLAVLVLLEQQVCGSQAGQSPSGC